LDIVQEQQNGSPSADLLIGLGIDERFTRAASTLLSDALGSTVALTSSATVQTSYGYDPYGATQVTGVASDNTFQFTGRENDGLGLIQLRNRYYSPAWGRFISEDPLGLGGNDINMYRYVFNDPINLKDPTGLYGVAGPDPTPPQRPTDQQDAGACGNIIRAIGIVLGMCYGGQGIGNQLPGPDTRPPLVITPGQEGGRGGRK
jgi:RHS repeat-associated protein